jgi:hypothetical protein
MTKYLRKQSEGGRIDFGLWFRSFQPVVTWLHCFWACCGEAEHHGKKHVLEQSGSPHGRQEADSKWKELETRYTLQSYAPK